MWVLPLSFVGAFMSDFALSFGVAVRRDYPLMRDERIRTLRCVPPYMNIYIYLKGFPFNVTFVPESLKCLP